MKLFRSAHTSCIQGTEPGAPLAGRRSARASHADHRGSRRAPVVEPLEGRRLLTVLPAGFTETQVATGFVSPTAMTVAPDGRMFVAEQGGELRVVKNGQLLPTPFLTIETVAVTERGFGGVEVDPNFAANGFVYVYYTAQTPVPHNRVSRFTADPANPDQALPGSETVIFEIDNSNSGYHQGGALHFGPDGKLYVAVGDHGGTTKAQQLTNLFGKMLRINPDGSIPADNPFFAQTTGNNRAIWALGLRNPFTFAIQPGTGTMYINDVGQNLWEEIDVGAAGANYGWPGQEGASTDPAFASPLKAFPHPEWRAITGASFYNPPAGQFPAAYTGSYFFGDLDRKWIKRIDPATGDVAEFATQLRGEPIDIDVAADGSLLYLLRPIDASRPGGVYQVRYSSTGAPGIGSHPQSRTVVAGQPVTFSVVASGAEPLTYQWQRDGVNIPGANASGYTIPAVTAADDGAQFRVIVTNGSGAATSNAAVLAVTTSAAPTATITAPANGGQFSMGETIAFAGDGADAEDGVLPASAFTWQVDYVSGGVVRPLVAPTTGSRTGTFTVPTLTPYTRTDVLVRVSLTVTDSAGLTHTATTELLPRVVTVGLASNLPGARLGVDGQPLTAPTSFAGVVGFERLLSAPQTQVVNGVTYHLAGWSDLGAAEHGISVPAADTTYTATYTAVDGGSGQPADPDLTVAFVREPPPAALTGSTARARLRIHNAAGVATVRGASGIGLYLSTDPYLHPDDAPVATVPANLKLRPGQSKNVNLKFTYPEGVAAGSYYLLARADPAKAVVERDKTNNVAAGAAPIALGPPTRDLSVTVSDVTMRPGRVRRGAATLLVRNDGNVPVAGGLGIELRASSDTTPDGGDAVLATFTRRLRIKPGASKLIRVRFLPAGLAAGSYYVTAAVDTANAFAESNEANNTVVSGTTFVA